MSEHGNPSSMNQQGQQQQHDTAIQPANAAPQPPPFNPLPSHHSSSLGHSVVPDLMKVYESLTHSSTPQTPASNPQMSAPATVQPTQYSHQNQPQSQQHNQSTQYMQGTHTYSTPQAVQSQQTQYDQQQAQYVQPQQQQTYYTRSQDPTCTQQQRGSSSTENHYSRQRANQQPVSQESTTSSARRSRKRSIDGCGTDNGEGQSRGRKKGSQSDGRWSKRFSWPDDLHRDFVSAIFDVGLKHSSPSALLEFMPKHDQITSERIKSHLQKYRLHRAKSRKEFMSSYDVSLGKFNVSGIENVKSLSSGQVAAHLTYTSIASTEEENITAAADTSKKESTHSENEQGGAIYLPQLTEAEKQSPIGASMGYLMGLFFSLRQQLMQQRAESAFPDANAQGHTSAASVPAPLVTDSGSTITTVSSIQSSFAAGEVATGSQKHQVPRQDLTVTWDSLQPQQQAHQTYASHPDTQDAAKTHQTHQQLISPSTRSNVEENNLMKREMQNQMAFQNKMRALKQQELDKYKNIASGVSNDASKDASTTQDGQSTDLAKSEGEEIKDSAVGGLPDSRTQYAGQTAGASSLTAKNQRGISFGAPEDFWNSGEVDDHLFEFLMNT